jgi:hypothetical protein
LLTPLVSYDSFVGAEANTINAHFRSEA